MHSNISLMISNLKSSTLCSISKQSIMNSSQAFNKNTKTPLKSNYKRKITVVKTSISANKDSMSIVEWKVASNVMKRLNWENKCLFGPMQNSKPSPFDIKKIEESNQIIQHETQIPIIEPIIEQMPVIPHLNTHAVMKEKQNFEALLSFPLFNESVAVNDNLNNKIQEWNLLRKNLEWLSGKTSIPSVSLILENTMPKERIKILEQWKLNMIRQLGEEGFQKYQRDLLDTGKSLHTSINSYLSSIPDSEMLIKKENMGHWKSLKQVFPNIRDVKLLEEFVMHPFLCYRGIVDCFAKYKNQLVVIDWKTSKKSKSNIKNTYDNPLQIAAYAGALNFDPKYQYLVNKGLIVIAYETGMPATVHYLDKNDMEVYWNEWLLRVKQFWETKCSEIESS